MFHLMLAMSLYYYKITLEQFATVLFLRSAGVLLVVCPAIFITCNAFKSNTVST